MDSSSLSSLSDLEAGVSKPPAALRSPPALTPRSVTAMFSDDSLSDDEPQHFLDACFLCHKPLRRDEDIFMYRGDTPFCSEECREEQIEMDEAGERNKKMGPGLVRGQVRRQQQRGRAGERRGYYGSSTVVAG